MECAFARVRDRRPLMSFEWNGIIHSDRFRVRNGPSVGNRLAAGEQRLAKAPWFPNWSLSAPIAMAWAPIVSQSGIRPGL